MRRVFGVIAFVLGAVVGLTGAAAAATIGPDDTLSTASHRLTASPASSAIVSVQGAISWVGPTLHLRAEARDHRPIFLGIGHADEVDSYLGASRYDSLYRFTFPWHPSQQPVNRGAERLPGPTGLDVWAVSSSGRGRQEVSWRSADGDWRVALLNADARPGVDADVSVAAEVDGGFLISLGVLAIGLVLAAGGVRLLRRRGRPRPATPEPAWSRAEVP
jgi:hypothetical protein